MDKRRRKRSSVRRIKLTGWLKSNRKWTTLNFAELFVQRAVPTVLFLAAAVFVSLLLQPIVPNAYVALLLAATAGCGWVGRRALGIAAGILASICVAQLFLSLTQSSGAMNPSLYAEWGLFVCAAISVGWLSGDWRSKQEELRAGREQYRILLDGVKDYAVFLLDEEGRVATWNTGAQRIAGYTAEEILGKTTAIFYSAEEATKGKAVELLAQAAERGSVRTEGWRTRKDGTRFRADV